MQFYEVFGLIKYSYEILKRLHIKLKRSLVKFEILQFYEIVLGIELKSKSKYSS